IRDVADHEAALLHRIEHREASGGGGVVASAECLAGGDCEVDHTRIVDPIEVRCVNMEPACTNWHHTMLAYHQPVLIGQSLGDNLWRALAEQGFHGGDVAFARLPG